MFGNALGNAAIAGINSYESAQRLKQLQATASEMQAGFSNELQSDDDAQMTQTGADAMADVRAKGQATLDQEYATSEQTLEDGLVAESKADTDALAANLEAQNELMSNTDREVGGFVGGYGDNGWGLGFDRPLAYELGANFVQTGPGTSSMPDADSTGYPILSPQDVFDAKATIAGMPELTQLSGNFYVQNSTHIADSADQRLSVVMGILRSRDSYIQDLGANYGIDPRAIAAAIAWEFSQNKVGYMSDLLPSTPFANKGWGWGEMHMPTLRDEVLPGASLLEAESDRNDVNTMIALVAKRIAQQRDTYLSVSSRESGGSGVDLSSNVAALTWLYNTSSPYVGHSALLKGSPLLMAKCQIFRYRTIWRSGCPRTCHRSAGWLRPRP